MNFRLKEKLVLWISGTKKKIFCNAGRRQKDDLSIVFFKKRCEGVLRSYRKNDNIFFACLLITKKFVF